MDWRSQAQDMIDTQLVARGIKDEKVLEVFHRVNRAEFAPTAMKEAAWGDHPLPIGSGQTISQPYMVAVMTELLELKEGSKVLEIGTGSGYQAAILAEIAKEVYSVERHESLALGAENTLKRLGYKNIFIRTGDGSCGWPEKALFSAIIITAGAPNIPEILVNQLETNGRLVAPIGGRLAQVLTCVTKTPIGIETREFFDCVFVPLVGEHGWKQRINL